MVDHWNYIHLVTILNTIQREIVEAIKVLLFSKVSNPP